MKYRIILSLAIMVLMSSCVSKKKFLAMQNEYIMQTDSLVDVTENLNHQLRSGEADFESTKHDLMISDAVKNDRIAALEIQLKELQSSFDEVTSALADTKDRYKSTLSEKDQVSYQMARMNKDLARLRQDTVSLNYALTLERKKAERIQANLDQQREKYKNDFSAYKEELLEMKKVQETSRLKAKELERQLAIKQQQMEEVNTAFIALRKEMLRAKAQGTVLDPNANANINKIAKSLGHY